jgi:hypothetical protein
MLLTKRVEAVVLTQRLPFLLILDMLLEMVQVLQLAVLLQVGELVLLLPPPLLLLPLGVGMGTPEVWFRLQSVFHSVFA